MKKLLTMLLRHWIKTPVKITLTILSVALGTGILILSFSSSSIIEDEIKKLMNNDGTILQVVNGTWGANGQIEQIRPSQWDYTVLDKLISDSSSIKNVALIFPMSIPNLNANGKVYNIRRAIGTNLSYLDVFSLKVINGVPMTKQDFDTGAPKLWISEDTAKIMFGSGEKAIGQLVTPPNFQMGNRNERAVIKQFTVTGVYEAPSEVSRRAYGIADIIYPLTAMLPTTNQGSQILNFLAGKMVLRSSSSSKEKVIAEIQTIITNNYSPDVSVTVWEGDMEGESKYMDELRQTVSIFSISVKILGIVLLLTSSLGIFSIMVVEALGRRREIAIERALGASKFQIVKEFWQWSIMLSLIGAIIGIVISVILSSTVLGTMSPLLTELSDSLMLNTSVKPLSILYGVLLAMVCGGFLGVIPAFTGIKGDISDTLREV